MWRLRGGATLSNVIAVVALVFAMGGGAYALTSETASVKVIHGCYQKRSGALRILHAAKKCSRSEQAIAWNQTGAQGSQGQPGSRGQSGPAGQQGPGVGSSRVDLQACKLEYSIVSPK